MLQWLKQRLQGGQGYKPAHHAHCFPSLPPAGSSCRYRSNSRCHDLDRLWLIWTKVLTFRHSMVSYFICSYYMATIPPLEKLSYSYTPNYLKEEKKKTNGSQLTEGKGMQMGQVLPFYIVSVICQDTETVSDAMTFRPSKTNTNGAVCSQKFTQLQSSLLFCQAGCRFFLKMKQSNRWISVLKRRFQMTKRCKVIMHPKAAPGTC